MSPGLLRICTAGSVDDGKSTLIGRLLYDSRSVYEDQLHSIQRASINRSAGAIDFSLFTDGLRAEREQGITIDVAYRYFATPGRKFIIGDAPGHEQYTRNMVTAASSADAAVVLVDATKLRWAAEVGDGAVVARELLAQTRRHTLLCGLRAAGDQINRAHQKYPAFLRFSIEASEVLSSMRVAPRSLTSTVSVSSTTSSALAAGLSTGQVQVRDVRFRTVGDITTTCPVASLAADAGDVVLETLSVDVSERGATRMDDMTSEASMEKRKKDGYF